MVKEIHMVMETETHHKQWGAELNGNVVTTAWGRIGNKLQSLAKPFPSNAEAEKFFMKKIKEKTNKGYVLVGKNF